MLDIERIEKQYDLSGLKYKDISLWSYLRGVYGPYSLAKSRGILENNFKNRIVHKVKLLRNTFYGFFNIFKKYDYIVFSDTDSQKLIDGYYYDRMAHGVIEDLGIDNTLYVENLNKEEYYNIEQTKYFKISYHIFSLISNILFLFSKSKKINFSKLNTINKQYNIHIDYSKEIHKFISLFSVYRFFFKIKKPKIVFVTCFTKRTIVKAANDLGITTVEFQHGVINDNYAYNLPQGCDYSFHSKYLLVYGQNDKKLFETYNYLENKMNVFTVGNWYLQKVSLTSIDFKINTKYQYKCIVSLQSPIAKEMISFINIASKQLTNYFFIVVPRIEKNLDTFKELENVKYFSQYNCYEIANECDIHISGYSSCVMEAPVFGLTNIFVNFKDLSQYYYADYIYNQKYNHIVNNEEEFVALVNDIEILTKDRVKELHSLYFESNSDELDGFVKIIKEIK